MIKFPSKGRSDAWVRLSLAIGALGWSVVYSQPASAQYFTLDRAQPSGAPDDGFMVFRPHMGEETRFYGNATVGFALNPLRKGATTSDAVTQRDMEDPVQGQFLTYLSAGTEILGRFGVNFMLPVYPYQFTGADPLAQGVGRGGISDAHVALGDLRIDFRGVFWQSQDKKSSVGGTLGFTVPTGTNGNFGGDRSATSLFLLSGEHSFGDLLVSAHVGPHLKPRSSIGGTEGDLRIGNELRYAVGAYLPIRDGRLRLGAEFWGSTGLESIDGQSTIFSQRNTTLEWLAQGRFLLDSKDRVWANLGAGTRLSSGYGSPDLRILAGIGTYLTLEDFEPKSPPPKLRIEQSLPEDYDDDSDHDGYPDAIDACPQVAEDGKPPKTNDGCPAPSDRDGDGIPDDKDKCPDAAEDFDGLADQDGCPEPDFDSDHIDDTVDACPEEPGPKNKDPGLNGCPTLTKVTDDGKVSIMKPIEFERGKDKIQPVSFPILDEVVLLLEARPEIQLSILGHTDNMGSRTYNLALSQSRADAVMKYLNSKGIAASRLSAKGYGPDKPIDTNDTADGRSRNRRVEFVIITVESGEGGWSE